MIKKCVRCSSTIWERKGRKYKCVSCGGIGIKDFRIDAEEKCNLLRLLGISCDSISYNAKICAGCPINPCIYDDAWGEKKPEFKKRDRGKLERTAKKWRVVDESKDSKRD